MNYKGELSELLSIANMALNVLSFKDEAYIKFLEFKRQVIDDLNYIQEGESEAYKNFYTGTSTSSPYGVSFANTAVSQESKNESAVSDAGNITDCNKELWTEEEEKAMAEYIRDAISLLTGSSSEDIKVTRVR